MWEGIGIILGAFSVIWPSDAWPRYGLVCVGYLSFAYGVCERPFSKYRKALFIILGLLVVVAPFGYKHSERSPEPPLAPSAPVAPPSVVPAPPDIRFARRNSEKNREIRVALARFEKEGWRLEGYSRGVNLKEGQNWMTEYQAWHVSVSSYLANTLDESYVEHFVRPNAENIKPHALERTVPYQGQGMSEAIRSQIRFLREVENETKVNMNAGEKQDKGLKQQRTKAHNTDGAQRELEVGIDSVVMGNVSGKVGNGSVVIGPTDSHGNTYITQPMAVGRNAHAGPGSIAIGANAGAGNDSQK